jgi:hypothetical protein
MLIDRRWHIVGIERVVMLNRASNQRNIIWSMKNRRWYWVIMCKPFYAYMMGCSMMLRRVQYSIITFGLLSKCLVAMGSLTS